MEIGLVGELIKTYFPPFPDPEATFPLAPTALGFLRVDLSCSSRCFLSFSARAMYPLTLARIISLERGFFSPAFFGITDQNRTSWCIGEWFARMNERTFDGEEK